MSKISLKPADTGSATFTLEAPSTNTNRTLALPDEAGTLATVENLPAGYTDSDALDLFNATGSAPVYACRAWVNFDGTGTVSIRDSGNVSSITDNGVGEYYINFGTSMQDANYSASGIAQYVGSSYELLGLMISIQDSDKLGIYVDDGTAGTGSFSNDSATVCVAIFR